MLITFHIVGAPLFIAEDTSYSGAGDGRSIYPFTLASGTYGNKFSGSNGGELARVARFRVFNPHPVACALRRDLRFICRQRSRAMG